jgi:hypothetical protein
VVTNTDDWSNIPYYPTTKERREQTAMYLVKTGKQVPISLLKQIQKDKEDVIEKDVFNIITNSANDSISNIPPPPTNKTLYALQNHPRPPLLQPQQNHRQVVYNNNNNNNSIRSQPPNIYSPEYASYVGARQRAASSVRIKLGGAY